MSHIFTLENINETVSQVYTVITDRTTTDHATIVCLHGDLGSGKTTMTKHIAEFLNIPQSLQSPTFVILKNYTIPEPITFKNLVHIDAYRLNNESDLEKLNWVYYYNNPDNLIIIEWAELIPKLIPDDALHINLKHIDETSRSIEIL